MADENTNQSNQQSQQAPAQGQQSPGSGGAAAFDYDKLAGILAGRAAATEDSVLRGYFKQQGITGEEAAQAIAAFKEQKAKNTPDPAALQQQVNEATGAALRATMENRALLLSGELGVELKTMPYVLKMADLSDIVTEGKVDDEKLKAAINKVLEAVPALKTAKAAEQKTERPNAGFQVGSVQTATAGGVGSEHKQLPMKDAIAARLQGQSNKT